MPIRTLYPKGKPHNGSLKIQDSALDFKPCVIKFFGQELNTSFYNLEHKHKLEHKNIIVLCTLIFPKLGRIRLARLFHAAENNIRNFLDKLYSPIQEHSLSNDSNRINFFHEIKDHIEIQYDNTIITIEQMQSILHSHFPELNKEPSVLSNDNQSMRYPFQHMVDYSLPNTPVCLNADIFRGMSFPLGWTVEDCWSSITPTASLEPMSPLVSNHNTFFAQCNTANANETLCVETQPNTYINPTELHTRTPTLPLRSKF